MNFPSTPIRVRANAVAYTAAACLTAGCVSGASDPFGGDGLTGEAVTTTSHDPSGMSAPGGSVGPSSAVSSGEADESGDEFKLDVGSPTGGFGSCACELVYLWVSDHAAGTVSKINTRTLEEEGRYLTRADGNGDPSRTSVNLSGDAAVANRNGGLVKIHADVADCVDSNGMPGIQTSTGKDDVLPWDQEECRAWFADFPTTNQRPVAWTGGTADPSNCDASDAQVWTITSAVPGLFPGMGGGGGVIAYLIDGQSGATDEEVAVDEFPGNGFGAYGAAVNAAGDVFFSPLGTFGGGKLARVEHSSLDVTIWDIPMNVNAYGITVDHEGRVWLSSTFGSGAARFDPVADSWDVIGGFLGGSGLAEGPDDLMYVSAGNTVHAVGLDSLALGDSWATAEAVKGVSFDADGFLWAVTWRDYDDATSFAAAYKIDVMTMSTEGVYAELEDPYTYSDMTGNVLGSVACAPEG